MSGKNIYGVRGVDGVEELHIKGYARYIEVKIITPYDPTVWRSGRSGYMDMERDEAARIVEAIEGYIAKTKTPTASDDSSDAQQACEATHTSCEGAHEVAHPSYYNQHPSGVECVDVAQHYCFLLGNVIKYVWRAGLKNKETYLEDLEKAAWYLQRKIEVERASPTTAHPSCYNQHPSSVEYVDISQHYCFLLGNVIKYVLRAGVENEETYLEDLEKAAGYLWRKIEQVKAENKPKKKTYEARGVKIHYPDGDLIYSEFGEIVGNKRFIVTGSSSGIRFTIDDHDHSYSERMKRYTVVLTYEQVTYMIGSLRRTFLRNEK